jgi:hypothetical protein
MTAENVIFWLTVFSSLCWPVCFWWMWLISRRQNALIRDLRNQARHIADVARDEHELLKDAHPQIGEIRDAVHKLTNTI